MNTNPPHLQRSLYVSQAQELCEANGATLLFLTLFGSNLYGTQSAGSSDVDLRGVFLPSLSSLILGEAPKSLHRSTGSNARRNTQKDVDIDLCSVQHWLLTLLPQGDIGALDLLLSPSNQACTLYREACLDAVFANPLRLLDTASIKAYITYTQGQAKKYGIKGSRVGTLVRVWRWLDQHMPTIQPTERLHKYIADILQSCGDTRYCFLMEQTEPKILNLCGKSHMTSIRMDEFASRVRADMQHFGTSALGAERNEGVDYKALSHAVRALYQMEELLRTGAIKFPLEQSSTLLAIKQGHYSWKELEPFILERLHAVENLQNNPPCRGNHESTFARQCVLDCYKGHSKEFA